MPAFAPVECPVSALPLEVGFGVAATVDPDVVVLVAVADDEIVCPTVRGIMTALLPLVQQSVVLPQHHLVVVFHCDAS